MVQSDTHRTEAKLKRHKQQQRLRALKLSLAVAGPLALVMAGMLGWLKATTPEKPVAKPATSPQPDVYMPENPAPAPDALARSPAATEPGPSLRQPPVQAGEQPPSPEPPGQAQFELDAIATALSRLNLDASGEVKLDQQAKAVLEAAFLQPDDAMTEARLAELKTLIEGGLQGEAGRQAADVAERYYRYSNAYRDIQDTFGYHGELTNLEANFEQLSRLRRTHLGDELTEALYGKEETLTRYTLQSMRIQSDPTLSPAEKKAQQEQLRKRVPTSLIGAPEQARTP
ncbi:lipase secretion chaperone [Marinobacter fonticola]|uniref:lipase secretion chaperone n=1 Tax=Marinobacter fonticola TaxID=2603215 RepID=UPI0011E7C75D|nr:lipase secretion chaperone [Marinobacter fonticola]